MPISDESSTNSKTDWYPSGLSFLSIILFPACTHHWVVVGYIYHTPHHNSRKRNQVNSREWIYAQRIHGLFRAHVAKILGKPMSFISSFLLQWKHKSRKGSFPHNQMRYFLTDCLFLNSFPFENFPSSQFYFLVFAIYVLEGSSFGSDVWLSILSRIPVEPQQSWTRIPSYI